MRKEVGFIKNHSSKKLPNIEQEQNSNSSDSFSSFEYQKNHDRQQFSPYKHPQFGNTTNKKLKEDNLEQDSIKIVKEADVKVYSGNHPLQNNFFNQKRQCKINQKSIPFPNKNLKYPIKQISKIKQDPHQQIIIKKSKQRQRNDEDEQLSLSDLNKFKKDENFETRYVNPIKNIQNKKYADLSSNSESEDQQNKKTLNIFKNKYINQKKISDRCQNHKEQLITEYDKKQFANKSIKTIVQRSNNIVRSTNGKMLQTKGGVCFQLDTHQFKVSNPHKYVSKNTKLIKQAVNSREQLHKRRQTAKYYDKIARHKIFKKL